MTEDRTIRKVMVHYKCTECQEDEIICPCIVTNVTVMVSDNDDLDKRKEWLDLTEKEAREGKRCRPTTCIMGLSRDPQWYLMSTEDVLSAIVKESDNEKKGAVNKTNRFSDIDIV